MPSQYQLGVVMDETKAEAVDNATELGQNDVELNANPQILDVCLAETVSCWPANRYS